MKNLFSKLFLVSLILFSTVVVGCKDDDNNNEITIDEYEIGFTPDTLYQTAWEGTLTTYKDGNPEVNPIKIMFTAYNYAEVLYINKNLGIYYTINDKYFNITESQNNDTGNPSIYLSNDFWLISITNKRMQMRTSIIDDKNYEVLDLKRIY